MSQPQPCDVSGDPTETVRVERLIDRKTLCELLDVSGEALRRWIVAGKFPKPLMLGNLQRWRATDYNEWVAEQLKRREQQQQARTRRLR